MRITLLGLLLLALTSGCTLLTKERRLAEGDAESYRAGAIGVVPVGFTHAECPGEHDRRSEKARLAELATSTLVNVLTTRGHRVQRIPATELDADLLAALATWRGQLCSAGEPPPMPPALTTALFALATRRGEDQLLLGEVTHLKWRLGLGDTERGALAAESQSTFELRMVAVLFDAHRRRAGWSEHVDTSAVLSRYDDTLTAAVLLDDARSRDPHLKLLYDFPPPAPR